mmetsp:Transcript_13556/g.49311  ORF Transcript_13556/g.49311 Transcript_13556/m.49311 type:complete len:171 (+) Transcript_13556:155-667(+)
MAAYRCDVFTVRSPTVSASTVSTLSKRAGRNRLGICPATVTTSRTLRAARQPGPSASHRATRLRCSCTNFIHAHLSPDEPLPLQLNYVPKDDIPPPGYTHNPQLDLCNPVERYCKEPIEVWYDRCKACCGTGIGDDMGTCIRCGGIGYTVSMSARIDVVDRSLSNGAIFE